MRNILAAVTGVVLILCSAPVEARQAANQGTATPETLALARRVVEITTPDIDKQVLAHMREAVAAAELHEIDPDVGRWMEKNAGPMLLPHIRWFMEQIADLYARRFTAEELGAMVTFYESDLGRSISAKQVSLGIETGELMQPLMERYATELFTRLCSEIDCEAGGATSSSAQKPARR